MKLKQRVKEHIRKNLWQYVLITLIFILGVLVGDYKVVGLEGGVKSHLLALIDGYLNGGSLQGIDGQTLLFHSFLNQAKTWVAVWFLGLTVIGMPLILAIVFFKGYSLGFTIAFLIHEKAGAGIIISIISILPQNIVYIPLLIVWAVVGINFSIYITRGRQDRSLSLGAGLLSYSLMLLAFLIPLLVGALIEAYLSPWLLSLFI